MGKFRKKPVVIDAWRFDGTWQSSIDVIAAADCGHAVFTGANGFGVIEIKTLEGVMTASPGDYIIRGVKGEFYPCKPDIFEATYEPEEPA
jgi:hypothetical protein